PHPAPQRDPLALGDAADQVAKRAVEIVLHDDATLTLEQGERRAADGLDVEEEGALAVEAGEVVLAVAVDAALQHLLGADRDELDPQSADGIRRQRLGE